MLSKIFKRNKTEVIKPFGPAKEPDVVSFTLCGFAEPDASALAREFSAIDQVEVVKGDILQTECDALVSPANSFGEMSGGLDAVIDDFYDGNAQQEALSRIRREFMGELPVGYSVVMNMSTSRFPYLILSPTMRIPGNVSDTVNAYLAMRATLVAIAKYNKSGSGKIRSVAIPCFCTGVGGMSITESAQQMRTAFENVVMGGWEKVKHPAMAPYAV